jgi:hypothetical protein
VPKKVWQQEEILDNSSSVFHSQGNCCVVIISERKILSLSKKKTFSTLTFKINSSGKQCKQKCKPFNCLFEAPHTSHPGVMCYDAARTYYIQQVFLEFYVIIQPFCSSIFRHVKYCKPIDKFWIILKKSSKLYTSRTLTL